MTDEGCGSGSQAATRITPRIQRDRNIQGIPLVYGILSNPRINIYIFSDRSDQFRALHKKNLYPISPSCQL